MTRKFTLIGISLVLLSLVLTVCPYNATAKAGNINDIIAAAQKEGKLHYFNSTEIPVEEVEKGLKKTFGVDIKITITPGRQTQILANEAMLIKAGSPPTFDVMHLAAGNYFDTAKPMGLIEEIDYKSLLTKDTDPECFIGEPADFPYTWGYVQTLAYNSDKIKKEELPQSYAELTDPKWKGKFGWLPYGSLNAELIFFLGLGREEGLQYLRDIVANKPLMKGHAGVKDALSLGEISFGLAGTHELNQLNMANPNTPVKTHILKEFLQVNEYTDIVLKGATNKNAATLLVLYFASPAGRAHLATTGHTSHLDPGTSENGLVSEAKKLGVKIIYPSRDPKYAKFMTDPESKKLIKDIDLIMKGARGGR